MSCSVSVLSASVSERRRVKSMQPPQQLVQWLKQSYPKPSVDEVRKLALASGGTRLDHRLSFLELAFSMLRVGGRGARLEPCHRYRPDKGASRVSAPHV
jgi:hypothetical protein